MTPEERAKNFMEEVQKWANGSLLDEELIEFLTHDFRQAEEEAKDEIRLEINKTGKATYAGVTFDYLTGTKWALDALREAEKRGAKKERQEIYPRIAEAILKRGED